MRRPVAGALSWIHARRADDHLVMPSGGWLPPRGSGIIKAAASVPFNVRRGSSDGGSPLDPAGGIRDALSIESRAAAGGLGTATSAGDLPANRQAATHSTRRPHVLVLAIPSLGRVAAGSGLRSARDCNLLAAQALLRSLGAHEPSWKARPTISKEILELIRKISGANPLWGTPRIVGELGKLGIDVAKSTVDKYRVRPCKPFSPTWKAFLRNHVTDLEPPGAGPRMPGGVGGARSAMIGPYPDCGRGSSAYRSTPPHQRGGRKTGSQEQQRGGFRDRRRCLKEAIGSELYARRQRERDGGRVEEVHGHCSADDSRNDPGRTTSAASLPARGHDFGNDFSLRTRRSDRAE